MSRKAVIAACLVLAVGCVDCGAQKSDPPAAKENDPAAFQGKIVFQSDMDGDNEIYLLASGEVKKLTDNSWNDEFPKWSPDGARIAFMADPKGSFELFVMNADGSGTRRLGPSDERTRSRIGFAGLTWSPDGKTIVFTVEQKRGLSRVYRSWSVDVESGRTEAFLPWYAGQAASPSFSRVSALVAFTGKKTIGWGVVIVDQDSRKTIQASGVKGACRPHFSPDGKAIAFVTHTADGKGDIWLMDPNGSHPRRLTERDETYDYFPGWSPDGRRIVFCSNSESQYPYEGRWALWTIDVATKTAELLYDSPGRDVFPDWHD